ncbi:tRNA (5-methylaminomethyl-2-thiouridine)(34)-methyltransferase MnmD [Paenalcaligenes hominis]|uniref:tRNA (5-methylaminomethyl-2-thiouridine)(34)-methyltransferase MnmD n=1 Tax=Paenalcaligenes hominis TaxID=643674 RepID=UPI003524B982
MTRAFQPLIPATPRFTEQGLACSDRYDDLYHSASGALNQAEYVFLAGNGLPERWQQKEQFTILETGFGLGNNFLATWAAWRADPQRSQRLHFVSFEAHPFYAHDLALMLGPTPATHRHLADQLLAQWPLLVPGIHRLEFEGGQVTLTLYFGEISQGAKRMECQADAFFLDGFAPRVNPAMWAPELFGQLVRMAAPNATAATWCSAAQVRRDLQNAGFIVERCPGFAFKRHMIKARLRPHLGRRYLPKPLQPVVIVGGGIAGAATAYALAQRGIASHVLDPYFSQGAGAAHLGHQAVAMTPLLTSDDAPRARLSRAGVLRARQRWQPFFEQSLFTTGAAVLSVDSAEAENLRHTIQNLAFDPDWVQYRAAGSQIGDMRYPLRHAAAFFPKAIVVNPERLISQLLTHPLITLTADCVTAVHSDETHGWVAHTRQHGQICTDHLVIANAGQSTGLLAPLLPQAERLLTMDRINGQSSVVGAAALGTPVSCIVAGQGYVLPVDEKTYVVGSTYEDDSFMSASQAHAHIMNKVSELVPVEASAPALSMWQGQRAALVDHLPVVAQALPGLWLNVGYGSYGFSWAALAADFISTNLASEPAVIERDLSCALYLR